VKELNLENSLKIQGQIFPILRVSEATFELATSAVELNSWC